MGVVRVAEGAAVGVPLRRVMNDAIRAGARRFGRPGDVCQFICECDDPACDRYVWMPLAQYETSVPGSLRADHVSRNDARTN